MLLWLWCALAAVALIQPLAWESLYATGAALKRKKKKKKKEKEKETTVQPQDWLYPDVLMLPF